MKTPVPTQTAGIYLLAPEHAPALEKLAAHPEIATAIRRPSDCAKTYVEHVLLERAEGRANVFVIMDRNEVVGFCGLRAVGGAEEHQLGFWVGRDYWGRGYATFGVKMVLRFAFQNLCVARVGAMALESNAAANRVLLTNGFLPVREQPRSEIPLHCAAEKATAFEIMRSHWLAVCHDATLASLHPALQKILAAERAAGNEISETSRAWPESGSVFVKLRFPFRVALISTPPGVIYTEWESPHSWPADYRTGSPQHLLACGES